MFELADVFRRFGPPYRTRFGDRMPPSHLKARWDIEHCRTEALGGQVYISEECKQPHYTYHSCQTCPELVEGIVTAPSV